MEKTQPPSIEIVQEIVLASLHKSLSTRRAGSYHYVIGFKGETLRQAQMASHPQLEFQERREGHALVAHWNSFEDEGHVIRFRRERAQGRGLSTPVSRFHA